LIVSTEIEADRLASIAAHSLYGFGANRTSIEYSFKVFRRYITQGPILELGPAEGFMTRELVKLGLPLMAVDGAEAFCNDLKANHPQIEVVHSLFEDFKPDRKFKNIVLGHVLEHVQDPVHILRRVKEWLDDDGRVLAAVPNSRSLHRQAAVILGLLETEDQLNEADRHHGHRRVYNPETFRRDVRQAGLRIELFGGYWLKPLSNAQIERDWSEELFNAFMVLGERYPDISGEIYVVATH
jgi:2-polyprenyl-3-methyl-5-hydroxy-6-metoxy-1,4-benzoquinol methylase